MTKPTISRVSEGIWSIDTWTRLGPSTYLPARATVVRLQSGALLIHSPVTLSDEIVNQVRKLGKVSILVSPNLYHHLSLSRTQAQFPEARTVAPRGLSEKVEGLTVDEEISDALPPELASDFDFVAIEGASRFNEFVLMHRPSQSLLVGDYFFNIQRTRGLLTPTLLRLTGTYKVAAQSRLWRRITEDRAKMKQSALSVLALPFQRIIMCHGDILDDGRQTATASLSWITESAP